MTVVFLVVFVLGLMLGVRVMLVGVERLREPGDTRERSFRVSPAVVAMTAIVFGAGGYVMERVGLAPPYATLAALVIAVIVGTGTVRAVNRWWAVTPSDESEDERYVLQGHFAKVTVRIGDHADGEVTFDVGPTQRVVRARSLDEAAVAAGTDVVIERIEDDVAYVEPWAEVEKRI